MLGLKAAPLTVSPMNAGEGCPRERARQSGRHGSRAATPRYSRLQPTGPAAQEKRPGLPWQVQQPEATLHSLLVWKVTAISESRMSTSSHVF